MRWELSDSLPSKGSIALVRVAFLAVRLSEPPSHSIKNIRGDYTSILHF